MPMRSILLAALLVPGLAAAQPALDSGARVRVMKALNPYEPRQTGQLITVTGDSAVIKLNIDPGSTRTYALSRLEVAQGQRTNALKGAGIGAVTGVVVGFALGYAGGNDCRPDSMVCFKRSEIGMAGAVAGALFGTTAGAVIGRLTTTDKWVRLGPAR
jgi:hypothetical protein